MNTLDLKSGMKLQGSYVIKTYVAGTKKLIWQSPVIKNIIVVGDGYGANLILRSIIGDGTYPLPITSASIGTGSTTPSEADTNLVTPAVTGIAVASTEVLSNRSVVLSFFMPDSTLPNNTYREFGIFSTLRLFARSLITPVFVKTSNQDTSVDYTISYV